MMTLKPFRDYSEHEVINLFALNAGSGNKGDFVQAVTFDPDNHSNFGAVIPGTPAGSWTADYVVNARVGLAVAPTGALATGCIGMMLYDTRTYLPYLNMPANLADPVRLAEQQVAPSGRAVPILTRGMVEVGGFSGTPYPNAAAILTTISGTIGVATPGTTTNRVGTWLSSSGVDGYALLKVQL